MAKVRTTECFRERSNTCAAPASPTLQTHRAGSAIAALVAFTALYFLSGKFGLSLAFLNASASPVWPPTGLALAALLLSRYRLWPAVFVGAFLVNLTTQGSAATSLAIAAGNSLEALLGAWLVQRFAGGPRAFDKVWTIIRFVLLAALLSTAVSPTVGVTSLCLGHFASWNHFRSIWLTWWLGDAISALTVAPLLLIWATQPFPRLTRRQLLEALALLLTVILVGAVVFPVALPLPDRSSPIGYLALLPLIWAAFRFGQRGAITAAILTSAIALVGTLYRIGPFIKPDSNSSLLLTQAFIGTLTLTALLLAAVVAAHDQAQQQIQSLNALTQARLDELNTLMEILPTGIWIGNPDCSEILGNPAAYAMMGLHPGINASLTHSKPQVPPGIRIFVDGAEVPPEKAPMQQVAHSGKPWPNLEHELLFPDGTRKTLYASIAPVFDQNGQVRKVIGAYADFTDRKRAELELAAAKEQLEQRVAERTAQLRETNAELEAFSYSLSHDLRAPLRSIRHFTQFALEDARENLGPHAVTLERVLAAAQRMDQLIQDVLAFSRVSRQEMKLHAVDVEKLVQTIASERPDWQPPFAQIQLQSPLPPIRGDEASLTQCITNLLDNAIKFVPTGAIPQVVIRSELTGDKVRLWFEDNGIGIDKAAQQKVFDIFQRANANGQYQGSGIGLAIVRKAVERMGGAVGVDSELGKGSRFWLELPKA
ncbi:MAG TPA: MASE1 domain-containing protein [Candidatus Binatia bacterium]|nr:MASE1 domain-containing protein [Candidatus Binatia bacterium]